MRTASQSARVWLQAPGKKGAPHPNRRRKGGPERLPGEPLLLGTRESTVDKLPERHLSAHGLAVGFARILHGETLALRIDLVFDRHIIALDRTAHLRLAQLPLVAPGERFALLNQDQCR